MSDLAERIRKSRLVTIEVGNVKFIGKRPTVEEAFRYSRESTDDSVICKNHVTGWENIKECDLIDGGSQDQAPFEKQVFDEVIEDKPEWFQAIARELLSITSKRLQERVENEKKSKPGSNTKNSKTAE